MNNLSRGRMKNLLFSCTKILCISFGNFMQDRSKANGMFIAISYLYRSYMHQKLLKTQVLQLQYTDRQHCLSNP